jgi:hypothetical protein
MMGAASGDCSLDGFFDSMEENGLRVSLEGAGE